MEAQKPVGITLVVLGLLVFSNILLVPLESPSEYTNPWARQGLPTEVTTTTTPTTTTSPPATAISTKPAVIFNGWWQNGKKIETSAVVNVEVTLRLIVQSSGSAISGTLGIDIRKDRIDWPDTSVHTENIAVNLQANSEQNVEVKFTPNEVTHPQGYISETREYFFKLAWNGDWSFYNPTTPLQRNGLQVTGAGGVETGGGTSTSTSTSPITSTSTPASTTGKLVVTTTPIVGDIYVNNVYVGSGSFGKNYAPGTYTVSFGDISGYVTPSSKTVAITAGSTVTVTGVYTATSKTEAVDGYFAINDLTEPTINVTEPLLRVSFTPTSGADNIASAYVEFWYAGSKVSELDMSKQTSGVWYGEYTLSARGSWGVKCFFTVRNQTKPIQKPSIVVTWGQVPSTVSLGFGVRQVLGLTLMVCGIVIATYKSKKQ